MSDDAVLLSSDHGPVRVLTMNRPQARNALSRDLFRALHQAVRGADADPEVYAVVLTGADPAFCAGVDLKEAAQDGPAYFADFEAANCLHAVAGMRTPVIGAVNGATFTGGLELALGCDFLIASPRAVFADTHSRVGILPGGGMTARLPRVVGAAMARRMSMTAEVVDAARAEQIGLVTEVVLHDQLLPRAVELAGQIAGAEPSVMLGFKEMYVAGAAPTLDPALATERSIARAYGPDFAGLDERRRTVMQNNKSQIAPG